MLTDARRLPPDSLLSCEVCIVGSGAAGITVALELAEAGLDVVLLEGGGLRSEADVQATYAGEVESSSSSADRELHPPLDTLRQKQLGGTTASWGGRCLPLDASDLATGWPIGLEQLDPFYRRGHRYLELGHFEYSVSAALPGAAPFLVADGKSPLICDDRIWRYSPPTHFGRAYRKEMRGLSKLRVYHHATAVGIDLDPDGTRAVAVVAASAPGRMLQVEAKVYVVAAGGLETTRLLLASGRAAHGRLGSSFDLIGRWYMTHVDGVIGRIRFSERAPKPAFAYEVTRDGVYCRRLVSLTEETRVREDLLNLGLVLHPPPPRDPSHGDGLLSAFVLTKNVLTNTRVGFKSARYGLREEPLPTGRHLKNVARDLPRLARFAGFWTRTRLLAARKLPSFLTESRSGEYSVLFNAEQSPSASSRVTLGEERDPLGVPRLRVHWDVAQSDYDDAARTLRLIGGELGRLGIGAVELPDTADDLRAALGGGFVAGTHAMGTTRMSSSPRDGVVDAECRLHGLPNVYAASSSVFPRGGFAAPTLTIVALAIRIADAVRRSLAPAA